MSQNENASPGDGPATSNGRNLTSPAATSDDRQANAGNGRTNPHPLPTKEVLLYRLVKIAELVGLGVLTPAKSNAMCRAYETTLMHLAPAAAGGGLQIGDAERRALHEHPELVDLLAPLLSDETLATFLKGFKDEPSAEQ